MGDVGEDEVRTTTTTTTTTGGAKSFGFKKRGAGARANVRKRPAASSSDEEDGDDGRGGNAGEDADSSGRKKRSAGLVASSRDAKAKYERFAFEGTKTVDSRGDMVARRLSFEIDTHKDMDGRAMREQVLKHAVDRADGFEDDKVYRGANAYVDYRAGFRREQTIASEKGRGSMDRCELRRIYVRRL